MRTALVMLLAFAALWCGTPISAKSEEVPLEPSSPWHVDFGKSKCSLVREFGEDAERTTVQLGRTGPLPPIHLAIASTAETAGTAGGKPGFRLNDDPDWTTAQIAKDARDGTRSTLTFVSFDGAALKEMDRRFAGDAPVVLHVRLPSREIAFDFGSMKAIKAELEKCEDQLMAEIGLEGPSLRTLRTDATATNPKALWITNYDYPPQLLRAKRNAAIEVRWIIMEDGSMGDCGPLEESGDASLASYVCKLLKGRRLHYKPALSAAGLPVKSYSTRRLVFTMSGGRFDDPAIKGQ